VDGRALNKELFFGVEGRAKSGNKTTDVETAANELVTCAKEMNGKMDVVEESEAQV